MKNGFTLIEILIAVILISMVGLALSQANARNRKNVIYVVNKPISSFSATLYNYTSLKRYHKSSKNSYDLLYRDFEINNDRVRKYLKDQKRGIIVDEEETIFEDKDMGISLISRNYRLEGDFNSSFFTIGLGRK